MFSHDFLESIIPHSATFHVALAAISKSGVCMACITDHTGRLLAILTDSDVRKAFLAGAQTSSLVLEWAQKNPVTASAQDSSSKLLELSRKYGIREIPIVDDNGCVIDIFTVLTHDVKKTRAEMAENSRQTANLPDNPVISNSLLIVAGGLGTRLREKVNDRPKPLAIVGDKPILETLIFHAAACGIRNFYISVNYMADMIEEHLNHEKYRDFKIEIIKEDKRLGTAGSISLIKKKLTTPLIVTNADLLTKIPFHQMVRWHADHKADLSSAVRAINVEIPFGVCAISAGKITAIEEKPTKTFIVNAGIYIVNPDICQLVPENTKTDMPDLIKLAFAKKANVLPFYMHEYWKDIGVPAELDQANLDYLEFFREDETGV